MAPAAEAEAVRLAESLAPLRVGLVHGRIKPVDRDAVMARFRDGDLDVLVGTTVVEVGVDVPEATMMIVEGADRFGLAQLHQLRGRVGRGTAESFCVLVSDSNDETAQARLKAVAEIRDGFELAEKDFEIRREGDVLGLAQSGLPRLRVASLRTARTSSWRAAPGGTRRCCSTRPAVSCRGWTTCSGSSRRAGWRGCSPAIHRAPRETARREPRGSSQRGVGVPRRRG